MSVTRFSVAISALAFIASCQMSGTPQTAAPGVSGSEACGASDLEYLVGLRANEIDFATTTETVRIVAPNSAVTMDHRPDRLNIHTNEAGVITKLSCG